MDMIGRVIPADRTGLNAPIVLTDRKGQCRQSRGHRVLLIPAFRALHDLALPSTVPPRDLVLRRDDNYAGSANSVMTLELRSNVR